MFDSLKAYAGIIVLAVVLAVGGYLAYTYDSTQKENKTLTTQVTVQKVEIKDLGETVEVTQKSGVINEQAVTETLQNRQVLEHKFEKLSKKADAEVAVLKAKPQPSEGSDMVRPAVSALPTPLDNQISQVRLNQLWDSYCLAAPQAEDCRQGAQP